jgi:RNase adaptor protein for sRNA GlmZ degradation
MIIWINGAFGSGKTQTAFELQRRLTGAFVYDPENAGYFIRDNIPKGLELYDFQDFIMWREFNYSMLKYITNKHDGIIIVPMTITNPQYFEEIIGKLQKDGFIIKHFVLGASKSTILRRLKSRFEGENSWPAQQIDRCIEAFSTELFKQYIDTENLSIQEVVEKIGELSKIELLPDNRSKFKRLSHRLLTQISHIRR